MSNTFCGYGVMNLENGYYVDINGNPVKRSPEDYPYNYSDYVIHKSHEYSEEDHWVYSDRMSQCDDQKAQKAYKTARTDKRPSFSDWTLDQCSKFLSTYYDESIVCTALMQSCNQATGFPLWIFAYYKVAECKAKPSIQIIDSEENEVVKL